MRLIDCSVDSIRQIMLDKQMYSFLWFEHLITFRETGSMLKVIQDTKS